MGMDREHRGHGYGTAITVAAAAAPPGMGSSSAIVCAESSNIGAIATYRPAGFQQLPDARDLHRGADQPPADGEGDLLAARGRSGC